MRDAIAVDLSESMRPFLTLDASKVSDGLREFLKQPCLTISYLLGTYTEIKAVLKRTMIQEDDVAILVQQNEEFLGSLSLGPSRRAQRERAAKKWNQDEAIAKLEAVADQFSKLLMTPMFNEDDARSIQSRIRELEEQYRRAEARLTTELPCMARLQMSTIGSSHKLLSKTFEDVDENEDDLLIDFEGLALAENSPSSDENAIVIFDEAGCIPDYELLGLTRLESTIEALILVGDKEQLPPYQSSATCSGRQRKKDFRYGIGRLNNRGWDMARARPPDIKSLLDSSRLSLDLGEKVKLTTQYRVPRDIADILNDRVYNGSYKTSPSCIAPARGLCFVDVRTDPEPRKKYVNKYEVDEVLDIVCRHQGEQVMILTPVSSLLSSARCNGSNLFSILKNLFCFWQLACTVQKSATRNPISAQEAGNR